MLFSLENIAISTYQNATVSHERTVQCHFLSGILRSPFFKMQQYHTIGSPMSFSLRSIAIIILQDARVSHERTLQCHFISGILRSTFFKMQEYHTNGLSTVIFSQENCDRHFTRCNSTTHTACPIWNIQWKYWDLFSGLGTAGRVKGSKCQL